MGSKILYVKFKDIKVIHERYIDYFIIYNILKAFLLGKVSILLEQFKIISRLISLGRGEYVLHDKQVFF
jgi:hypothetical protein